MLSSSLRLALYCTVQKRQNPSLYLDQQQQTFNICLSGLVTTLILKFNNIFISQFIFFFQRAVCFTWNLVKAKVNNFQPLIIMMVKSQRCFGLLHLT